MAGGQDIGFACRTGDLQRSGEFLPRKGLPYKCRPVSVVLVFVAFVLIGDSIAVGIASIVERFSESASLLVFLALFVLVFWVGWLSAVRVTERSILRLN